MSKSSEERIAALEEAVKNLQHEVERTQAVTQIQNVFGKLQFLHTAGRDMEAIPFYAQKTPGVKIYRGEQGYWEGPDAARKTRTISSKGDHTGIMPIHLLTTPIIEVARDGKTAKGVWVAAGLLLRKDRQTGEPKATWEWDRYGIDWVKEDGQWRLWHHHIYRIFHGVDWDGKWADQFKQPPMGLMDTSAELRPDGPAVDDYPYRLNEVPKNIPQPPEPYETFDPQNSY